MDFSNKIIPPEQLPTVGDILFHPLKQEYLKVSRISFIISGSIVLIIGVLVFVFAHRIQTPAIIGSSVAAYLLLSFFGWHSNTLGFKYSGYALREKDIIFRRGWLVRKVRAVPLKRIQHVSIQSGPLERKFGLSSISIYTAGSEHADFTIRGITKEAALQIKEWISAQLNEETEQ